MEKRLPGMKMHLCIREYKRIEAIDKKESEKGHERRAISGDQTGRASGHDTE